MKISKMGALFQDTLHRALGETPKSGLWLCDGCDASWKLDLPCASISLHALLLSEILSKRKSFKHVSLKHTHTHKTVDHATESPGWNTLEPNENLVNEHPVSLPWEQMDRQQSVPDKMTGRGPATP